MKKISIIIPIFNSANTLDKCINSLICQSYSNLEIILIDDGSLDNSFEICKMYQKKDKRIIIYQKKNTGVSDTRNFGINIATGDYICFVDSDDFVHPDFCKVLLNNMNLFDADLSCCGYYESYDNNYKLKLNDSNYKTVLQNDKYIGIYKYYQGFLCNKLYKSNIIKNNNLKLNENIAMCEDLLFNVTYLKLCDKVVYDNNKLYCYYISKTNASRKLSENWFDIITVYNKIINEINRYDKLTKKYFYINYLLVCYEFKIRCELMNLNYNDMKRKYEINTDDLLKKYYSILFSSICFKDKIRLIGYRRIYFIFKIIKTRKMERG